MRRLAMMCALPWALIACDDDGGGDDPVTPAAEMGPDAEMDVGGDLGLDAGPSQDAGDAAPPLDAATIVPDGDVAPTDWCAAWRGATAERAARCPGDPAGLGPAPGDCRGPDLAAAIEAGEVDYDEAAGRACLNALAGACYGALDPCVAVLRGQVAAGGACFVGWECDADSRCSAPADACPRTCEALAADGAACSPFDQPCRGGLACLDGTCAPAGALGAPCVGGWCAPGAGCDVDGVCRAVQGVGGVCGGAADGGPCGAGLTCRSGADGARCAPLGLAEAPCSSDADCAVVDGAPLACVGGRCAPLPEPGALCYELRCGAGRCDVQAAPPTCLPWPAAGEACAPGNRCGPMGRCVDGACAPRAADGEPCTGPADCASARCGGEICRAADAPLCPRD